MQARGEEQAEAARLLKVQLDRAQQGLEAAARLSSQVGAQASPCLTFVLTTLIVLMTIDHALLQLDAKTKAISSLRQEISAREEMIRSYQEKLLKHTSSQVQHCSSTPAARYSIAQAHQQPGTA